jgi:spore coat protein H
LPDFKRKLIELAPLSFRWEIHLLASFRKMCYNIMNRILHNEFTLEYMRPKIEQLYFLLLPHELNDLYIYKGNIQKFDAEPDFIYEFIVKRNTYLKNRLSTLL